MMEREDFWYNQEAKKAKAIPTGAKVGQFLFLSAQTSIDLDSGKIIRDTVDLPREVRDTLLNSQVINANFGPIMAQTWQIYQNLKRILAKQGASLKDIVRQRIFVPHLKDVNWVEKVMLSFFPGEKPATLILGVSDRGLHPDIRVWVDAIVLLPQPTGLQKEIIHIPDLEKVTLPYPQAIKVGQFLFFEGYTGVDPESGQLVTRLSELGAKAKEIELEGRLDNAASVARRSQFWLVFSHLKRLLQNQGATLDDILVSEWFSRQDMWDYCNIMYLRRKLFKPPAPLGFGSSIHNLSPIPDVELIEGGLVLLPGEYRREIGHRGNDAGVLPYSCVSKAGFFAHGGGMGLNMVEEWNCTAFSDLTDHGRFQTSSRIDCNHPIMAKTWYIYQSAFYKANIKPEQVIHQTIYLENPAEWPAVESIARIIFNGHIPATTLIPVDDIACYWQYHTAVPESIGGERIEVQFHYVLE